MPAHGPLRDCDSGGFSSYIGRSNGFLPFGKGWARMAIPGKGEDPRPSASVKEGDGQRSTPALPETSFSFGPFRLLPRQHLLLQNDKPVSLGSRAFEILIALVEHAGELLD